MKHKAFTEIVAHSTEVPEKTVALFARTLKSAGLLTSGARGVNAPEMTPMDLARLLIALCATDRPKDAVEEVNWYRNLPCAEGGKVTMQKYKNGQPTEERRDLFEVKKGDRLEDIMAGVFGCPPLYLAVIGMHFDAMVSRRRAAFAVGDSQLHFCDPDLLNEYGIISDSPRGIDVHRSLGNDALTEMALPFGLEAAERATWEEMTADGGRGAAKAASRHIFGVKDEHDG